MSHSNPDQFPAPADPHIADITGAPRHEQQFVGDLLEHSMVQNPGEAASRREDFAQYAGDLATEVRMQEQAQFYTEKATSWNGFVKPETDTAIPAEIPKGFSKANLIKNGALIRTDSLEKTVISLNDEAHNSEFIEADVLELMTDSGELIRYCDIRDRMTSSVRKGGPETKQAI